MTKKTEGLLAKKISRRSLIKMAPLAGVSLVFFPSILHAASKKGEAKTRIGIQSSTVTRFVLEIPVNPAYSLETLSNPSRVVIDVQNFEYSNVKDENASGGVIEKIRRSTSSTGTSRFVLDLSKSGKIKKHFTLPPSKTAKNRLVVDIEHTAIKNEGLAGKGAAVAAAPKSTELKAINIKEPPEKKKKVIVIDPGHGGKDPGAIGKHQTYEKNIVLQTSKKLAEELKQMGFEVHLTRSTDVYLKLKERSRIAQQKHADLFLSIHADSHPKSKTKGLSVYTLSEKASDEESAYLAERENAADLIGISGFDGYAADVRDILGDMKQSMTKEQSIIFANLLVEEVESQKSITKLKEPKRSAPFMVLRSPIASALVEIGFISNPTEEKRLLTKSYQTQIAKSIAKSVNKYPFI